MNSFDRYGIKIPNGATGNIKTICPNCTPHDRKPKNRNSKDLSVNIAEGVWNCHNCGWKGALKKDKKVYDRPQPLAANLPLSLKSQKWLNDRGLSQYTLQRFKISDRAEFMPQAGKDQNCLLFPYYRNDDLINVKFRDGAKNFKLHKGAELIFFNLDSLQSAKECVVTEGEIDCMSVFEAGWREGVVSVPNGASKGSMNLEYLDNCWQDFEHLERIVIATDGDEAGTALRNELGRRLGKHRCQFVEYPDGCKDANDVLIKHGKERLIDLIANATSFPIVGIQTLNDFETELDDLYVHGVDAGQPLYFPNLDKKIRQRKGELTTVTGIPGSGKSKFVDQIADRLAAVYGWRVAFCSPEKSPAKIHAATLISLFTGKSFFTKNSDYKVGIADYNDAKEFIKTHYFFFNFSEVDQSITGIVEKATELVKKYGLSMLVIDPWNYLEHQRPQGMTETDYVSMALGQLLVFAKNYEVLVYLVAHPRKIEKNKQTGKYEIPTMYSISGSAHFFNKTDNGICVYRDFDTNEVMVYVQKIRWDFVGEVGCVSFQYDKYSGRYAEAGEVFVSDSYYYERRLNYDSKPQLKAVNEEDPF